MELLFQSHGELAQPKQFMEKRVYLGLRFQRSKSPSGWEAGQQGAGAVRPKHEPTPCRLRFLFTVKRVRIKFLLVPCRLKSQFVVREQILVCPVLSPCK